MLQATALPSFTNKLGITPALSESFCFLGATPAELRNELIRQGWPGELPDPAMKYLAFKVAPMGWSWAVWAAQRVLTSLCPPKHGDLVDSSDSGESDQEGVGVSEIPAGCQESDSGSSDEEGIS